MTSGQIAESNVRMSLVIPRELKAELEKIAADENRSLNNLIVTVLKDVAKEKGKK